jgi:signal peptidase II
MTKWRLFLLIVLCGLAADQVTKFMAVDRLTTALARTDGSLSSRVGGFYTFRHLEPWSTEPHVVWKPMWRMRYAENPGAAWGLFRELSLAARNTVFSLTLLGAVIFILFYFRKLTREQRLAQVALSLVFAGAIGNFIDRLARGYVVDFIDWHWWNRPDLYWPTFNIADSMIVVGVLLLVLLPAGPKPAKGKSAGA